MEARGLAAVLRPPLERIERPFTIGHAIAEEERFPERLPICRSDSVTYHGSPKACQQWQLASAGRGAKRKKRREKKEDVRLARRATTAKTKTLHSASIC